MIEEFEHIPEITEEQKREINDYFTAYIFYEKRKLKRADAAGVGYTEDVYDCTCTHCNTSYTHYFEGSPKHNSNVICPKCNTKAILKHVSYGKKKLREEQRLLIFCPKDENTVWMRAFYASKTYNGDPEGNKMLNSLYLKSDENLTPKVNLSETTRYLLTSGSARCWKFGYNYYSRIGDWFEEKIKEPFQGYMYYGYDYYILSKDMLKNTFLRYLNLQTYLNSAGEYINSYTFSYYQSCRNSYLAKFICDFAQYPIIESLLKAGYGDIVCEKIIGKKNNKRLFNWKALKITDFFKTLNKSEIKELKNEDYQIMFLKALSQYKKCCKKSDIHNLRNDLKLYGYENYTELLSIVKKHRLNYTKAKNYVEKHTSINRNTTLQLWKDYLEFATKLKYDLKNDVVIYPKNLQEAHDETSKLVSAMMREAEAKKMKSLTLKLKNKYSFEYQGLKIVVPESTQDIIDEGKALSHCVGGYADRHANGKLVILFIRKKSAPNKPFVTMEVQGKKIVQYHGYRNDTDKPLSKQVVRFVNEFKRYIDNPKAYNNDMKKARKTA